MAEGKLKTVWEHYRENRIPYPENKPDWIEYALWYRLCDQMDVFAKAAANAKSRPGREHSGYMAAFYGRLANRFLEGHIRAAIRDVERGMPPEAVAEMNGAGPNDPVCLARWVWDFSPSQSPLPEFRAKAPYPGMGDTRAEMEYFGYERISDSTDAAVIRQRAGRCLELWRRDPDDLSRVEMREWVILQSDCPWVWLTKIDPKAGVEMLAEVPALRKTRSHHISDGKTAVGRYLERRRKAKAALFAGDWSEPRRLASNSCYSPSGLMPA
jgi:hypothetical protein